MNKSVLSVGVATAAFLAGPAAATVTLNFEGIGTYPNNEGIQIQNYYNGGTSSNGSSGPNYGVSFGDNAITLCLNTPGVGCSNTSRGGVGDPATQYTALFFLSGDQAYMNVAAGFDTGFSFNYASNNTPGFVDVYDGPNGTGNILAILTLPVNAPGCGSPYNAAYCPFGPQGVTFSGTAHSVGFGGVANYIVFDDITLGSATPGGGAVPEPATWATMLLGFGVSGAALRRRRRKPTPALA